MKKILATTAVILAASTGIAAAQNWSAEIYGGASLQNTLKYGGISYDTDQGTTLGFGVYNTGWVQGLALGIDVMYTNVGYTVDIDSVDSTSLMLNARYAFPLGGAAEAYVGAGLGAINVHYDGASMFPAYTGSDVVAGGQVELGMRYRLAAGNLFGAVKYQAAFEDARIKAVTQEFHNTSVIVGYAFNF
ncbi:outer membrane beta-barrel protein [Rhodobacter ferrooxidans]|uniref:Outer membrane protein beta-barrel domain-containing protein n=1 Tax=Rhodobacter ferrooxidans TaxID=371731 RepID=C8RXR3_9RHOB|nr:outer membrane beta-barrel protein [Rhodobacter sp. SW2]EEW26311.1 hypothetical protein Rsw2DRAFT_0591 [Rhodobacter sp. SW2]